MNNLERIERLELDLDSRLLDLWVEAEEITVWSLDVAARFFRAAYGKGYSDALTETVEGTLFNENGYKIPDRRRAA
jgi:hypothetical protein